MKDFYEAFLMLPVPTYLAGAYKKAIETENSRYWAESELKNKEGKTLSKENKIIWNGNYVHVDIDRGLTGATLKIGMTSHTLPNLKQSVEWYDKMGAEVVYKSWE